jgi:hypothetical protein
MFSPAPPVPLLPFLGSQKGRNIFLSQRDNHSNKKKYSCLPACLPELRRRQGFLMRKHGKIVISRPSQSRAQHVLESPAQKAPPDGPAISVRASKKSVSLSRTE